jgi:hypothetical protein
MRFVLLLGFVGVLAADEGMWTFDNPPSKLLQEKYNFALTKEWLDHVRLSSVRLNDGGSGSFVSPHGLLLTNHHVAREQLQKSSTAEHDYIANGFLAQSQADEIKSPDLEINVLISSEDVTARVSAAKDFTARKKVIAEIEAESSKKTGLRSDVITLYNGAEYWLYRYKKYTDIRIVFAPEAQAAYFGGDPDNFTYPRYDLDMTLLRVYENGKPIDTPNYLKWNPKGAAENELVFVAGNPGSTQRLNTLAQLEDDRDNYLPNELKVLHHRIAVLEAYSKTSAEHARQAASSIFILENDVKELSGEQRGLNDPRVMQKKRSDEEKLRAAVMAKPELKAEYGSAWDEIGAAEKKAASRVKERFYHSTDSRFSAIAMQIVEYVVEVKKPDGQRLPGFHEAQLESLRYELLSPAPIYKEMEEARIAGALELDLQEMGPRDAYLQMILAGRTPQQTAKDLVSGTHLDDAAFRKKLLEGGESAVNASTDPMIVLARKLDPARREFMKWIEDNVESVEQRGGEKLGRARFAVYGKSTYPDATFTLRLSYGTVKGYPMNGTEAAPHTTFFGLYDRAAGFNWREPFNLTSRYQENREKLDLSTPLNFVTTDDIIGGNSGSPVINRAGELVGLIFDGNIESLVGNFVYDIETNRAVAVHTAGMTEALRKLYGAGALVDEMLGK